MNEYRQTTINTPTGPLPQVSSPLTLSDRWGAFKVRWGIGRMNFLVEPGLYALGEPNRESEILVTANYRMTFDHLRSTLSGHDAWILVLDTRGINVWCAAGKGTFGTEELASKVKATGLAEIVDHRRLIVPQLGAVGIAAHKVKELSGFTVLYGPVEARDINAYLANGLRASPDMRRKAFPVRDRAVLIPMELVPALKYAFLATAAMALLAGIIGPGYFLPDMLRFGAIAGASLLAGVAAGAVLVPLLLPWVPGRAFSLKGLWTGIAAALLVSGLLYRATGSAGFALPWMVMIPVVSSFLAMNFTGSSTYTSLSGVRKEMRVAVPLQAAGSVLGIILWLGIILIGNGGAV